MYYDAIENRHGLRHDPFKALIVPRPIGWISTTSKAGVANLAPYSFFNAVGDRPHYVVIGSGGVKDTLRNIQEQGEFVCNLATYELRGHMNITSATVPYGVDEFKLGGLTAARCEQVAPPRVKEAPAAFECRVHQIVPLPGVGRYEGTYHLVIGLVVGVHIEDRFIKDGLVDTAAMQPIARLGYMDYAVVTPQSVFSINRPDVDSAGNVVAPAPAAWDGKYR
ncbi:MAG: flavin reductase family protein [Hyphomicrobiales bacterium]|nr:flavin reductase family protein [Hyphomicrobiales bacterium]